MKPQPGSTVDTVHDFWQSHINNEYYTGAERASDSYFNDIEERRYRCLLYTSPSPRDRG